MYVPNYISEDFDAYCEKHGLSKNPDGVFEGSTNKYRLVEDFLDGLKRLPVMRSLDPRTDLEMALVERFAS